MTDIRLTKLQISEGVWTGRLRAAAAGENAGAYRPQIEALHLTRPVPGVSVLQDPGDARAWTVSVPIPLEALNEGIQTVVIRDHGLDQVLASFAIITGEPLEDDIRAETNLIRAELDMLKKSFRRHCLETTDPGRG